MYPNQNGPYGNPQQSNPGWPPNTGSASPYPPAPGYPGGPLPGYPPNLSPYPATTPGYPPQQTTPAYPGYPQVSPAPAPSPYGAPSPAYPPSNSPYPAQPTAGFGAPPTGYPPSPLHQEVPTPTIRPVQRDAVADANVLRKAMKGFGTDEQAIIQVLVSRTNAQLLDITKAFKTSFGKDLIKELKSELSGKFEDVVIALMTPRSDFIAKHLHKAISGLGTREKSLVDVLCTSSNQEIFNINQSYTRLYKNTLEKDLRGDTSGHFKRLLLTMIVGARDENPGTNPQRSVEDARELYQAGVKKFGTDESKFNQILCTRSYAQLGLMFQDYEKAYGMAFETVIEREFSGDIKMGLMAVVKCAKNRAGYFAGRIHDSVAGVGTKDDDLIFLMVTRAEIDLESVKQEYQRMYNKSLASDIAGDTSGHYKKILIGLLGN